MNRIELKTNAKQQIKGKIGKLFLVSLIVALISGGLSVFYSTSPGLWTYGIFNNLLIASVFSIISFFVVIPAFEIGLTRIYIKISRNGDFEVKEIFDGFNYFLKSFCVNFMSGLFIFLWSLLLVVPGIIKAFSYAMAPFIIADDPETGVLEAISRSKVMMHGHKGELFVLILSFIGWAILSTLTLGILYIWTAPYMMATYTNFYNKLLEENSPEVPAGADAE